MQHCFGVSVAPSLGFPDARANAMHLEISNIWHKTLGEKNKIVELQKKYKNIIYCKSSNIDRHHVSS